MMITLLLLLLPALVSDRGLVAASPIDWTQCKTTRCFCWNTLKTDLVAIFNANGAPQICENVGIQSKFLTADIALIQMHVIGDEAANLGDEPSIMFLDDATPTFGCKLNKKTGKVELAVGDKDIADKYKLSLFEDRSQFNSKEVICAVLMELAFNYNKRPPRSDQYLVLNGASEKKYKLEGSPDDLYTKNTNNDAIKCNPFSFKDLSLSGEFHVKPIKNRDSDHLNCDNYNNEPGISYTMKYYTDNEPQSKDIKELLCEKHPTSFEWGYNLVTEPASGDPPGLPVLIPNPEAYTFYCAAPFNEMCTKPACTPIANQACPAFNTNKKTVGQPPTLECTENKWVLDGKFYQLAAQPACQLDDDDADNGSAFYATLPGEDAEQHKITGDDRCFTDYDCTAKSFLDMPSASDEASGGGIDKVDATNVLRCVNHSRVLRVTLGRDNLMLNDTSYVCNKKTGEWYNDTTIVPEGAFVACIDTHVDRPEAKALGLTEGQIYTYIGVAFVSAVLVLIGCAGCVYVIRSRMLDRQISQSDLVKMKRSELIKTAYSEFDKSIRASPATKKLIINGLELITTMVRSDTYDSDCWAKAYLFLVRLQTAAGKLDSGVYNMINRYMFLQAKKIIDKHGWLADKPVMRSTFPIDVDSHEELMRVVAIRLLVFPLLCRENHSDAEHLLCEGFRQLGWRGGTQYPHAGVLWSVMAHARLHAYEEGTNEGEKAAWWKRDHFLDRLAEIAEGKHVMKMPDEMVMPEFGTVRQQAAYALGGAGKCSKKRPYNFFNRMCLLEHPQLRVGDGKFKPEFGKIALGPLPDPAEVLAVKNPEIPLAAFAGMCEPIERNAVEMIILGTQSAKGRSEKALEIFAKIRPDADWQACLKKAQKFVAYCGAAPDAQKLHNCLGPESVDYKEELFQMQEEQSQFEAAVEAALHDLRKWLAERTDKDEFKQEPVFLENTGANKVNDVIPDQSNAAKPLGESCDGSASASKTEQASGGPSGASGSSGSKSSSDEAAPAAAAAAATPTTPDAAAPAAAAAPAQP